MEVVFAGVKRVAVNEQVAEFGQFENLSVFVASPKNKLSDYFCTFKALQAVADCSYVLLNLFCGRAINDH